MTPEVRYERLADDFRSETGVSRITEGKGFGSSGQLKVDGRIFVMLVRAELVLKLPRARVDELVASGDGRRFDAGKGKPMREWLVVSSSSRKSWRELAREAFDFVR